MRARVALLVVLILSCCRAGLADTDDGQLMRDEFAGKVAEMRRAGAASYRWPFSKDAKNAAAALAGKYGTRLIPILREEAKSTYDEAGSLAFATLVRLGSNESAREALRELAAAETSGAMLAISMLDRNVAVEMARSLLDLSVGGRVRAQAVGLLGVLGNGTTLEYFQRMEKAASNRYVQEALGSAISDLEHRRALETDEQRDRWQREALLYWRFSQGAWYNRSVVDEFLDRAAFANRQGVRFSLDFLRYRLGKGEALAAAILGIQGEKDALEDLNAHLDAPGYMASVVKDAIRMIEEKEGP
jgi:hypothetical protein